VVAIAVVVFVLLEDDAPNPVITPTTMARMKIGTKMMIASMMYATNRIQKPPYVTCGAY
jgi:hypothetical protein